MRILLPGGRGQIGTLLARHFAAAGHEPVILSRSTKPAAGGVRAVQWDGAAVGDWAAEFEGAGAVINLAGRTVNCRYTSENRRQIFASRLDSTRAVGEAILGCESPPPVWLNSGTATIYPHTEGPPAAANDETSEIGNRPGAPDTWRFSFQVAKQWEDAADAFLPKLQNTRLVILRSAMVMSPDPGGVFDVLRGLVRARLGGTQGPGTQYVSWVHERDFCAAVDRLIADGGFTGPVNLCAPNPLPNKDFMRALRDACGVSFGLPATRWMLELGAVALRTESELILKSRRVVPGKLAAAGFAFQYPDWPAAARELCQRAAAAR